MKLRLPKALCSALTLAATALCFAAPSASALEVTTSGGDFTLTQTQLKAGAGDYGDGGYAYSLTAANTDGIVSLTLTGSTLKDASTSFTVNVNGVGTAISSKVDLLTRKIAAGVSAIYQIRTKEVVDEDLGTTKTTRLFGTETDASQPSATGYMSFSNLNLLVDFTSGQGVTATSNFLSTPLTAGSTVVSNLSNTIVLNTNYINSITFTVPETTVVSYGYSKTSIYEIVEQNTLSASGVATGTDAVVLTKGTYTLSSPTSIGSLADSDVYIGGTAQLTLNSTAGSAYQNGGTGSIILDESTREDNTSLVLSASSSSNSYLYLGDIKLVTGSTTIQINDGEEGRVTLMGTLGGTKNGTIDPGSEGYGAGDITLKGGNSGTTHGLTLADDSSKIDAEKLTLDNATVFVAGSNASAKAGAVEVTKKGSATAEMTNVTLSSDGLKRTGVDTSLVKDAKISVDSGSETTATIDGVELNNDLIELKNACTLTVQNAVISGTTSVTNNVGKGATVDLKNSTVVMSTDNVKSLTATDVASGSVTFTTDILAGYDTLNKINLSFTQDLINQMEELLQGKIHEVAIVFSGVEFDDYSEGDPVTQNWFGGLAGQIPSDGTVAVTYGSTNGTVILSSASNIPEPATGVLSLLALAGLAARRRRK